MGNIFGKKRIFTEELENLTVQMKGYKEDIERTSESRRMLLWYLTLLNFFISTSICGYAWFYYDEKHHKIILSVSGFIAGFLLLLLSRKLVNVYYEWRLTRKRKALDELYEKKKTILETVKETKTFKEAKEILEKYDDVPVEPPVRPIIQGNTPTTERRGSRPPPPPPGTPLGPPPNLRMRGPPSTPAQGSRGTGSAPSSAPGSAPGSTPGSPQQRPAPTPHRKPPQNIPMSASIPSQNLPIRPVRPFHQVPNTTVDRIVDYFFSDGPNNRMALICSNCHGHNGMALPEEFDYLAYVCFICKHFNPAKKMRAVPRPPPPPQMPRPQDELKPDDKDSDHGKESPAPKSETATEDEFDVVASQHSTDEEETDTK